MAPVVVAVAVKWITMVPPGRIAYELPLVRLTSMKPVGGVLSTCHTAVALPGLVAVTEIELGVPVATAVSGDGRVSAGVLPAGRYATLVYTGLQDDIAANAALLNWGAEQGLVWDKWVAENGDAFGARLESYLTDPNDEPDPEKWETEVAIRLADDQPGQ